VTDEDTVEGSYRRMVPAVVRVLEPYLPGIDALPGVDKVCVQAAQRLLDMWTFHHKTMIHVADVTAFPGLVKQELLAQRASEPREEEDSPAPSVISAKAKMPKDPTKKATTQGKKNPFRQRGECAGPPCEAGLCSPAR